MYNEGIKKVQILNIYIFEIKSQIICFNLAVIRSFPKNNILNILYHLQMISWKRFSPYSLNECYHTTIICCNLLENNETIKYANKSISL